MKAKEGSEEITIGNYNVTLFIENCLNLGKIEAEHGWHDNMCMYYHDTFSHLSYNIHDGENALWNQAGGTGFIINDNFKSRKAVHWKATSNLEYDLE